MKPLLAVGLALLLAFPAMAQTDDRISNDALQLLAADTVVTRIGELCLYDTLSDPVMVSALEGWRERNHTWRIVAVTTLGMRGVDYPEKSLEMAQAKLDAQMMQNYVAAEDKMAWCLRMANDIESGQMSAGLMFPDAAKRIEEAKQGKWPVLDVANSYEVAQATDLLDWFDYNEQLLARCAEKFGDPRGFYKDAFPYWRMRNVDYLIAANKILANWGALDPRRTEKFQGDNREDLEFTFEKVNLGQPTCERFILTVEDGEQDVNVIDPQLAEFLLANENEMPEQAGQ